MFRRPGFTALHHTHQRRQLVVQLDGEVQRVLVAPVADLVDLLLHRRETLLDLIAAAPNAAVVRLLQATVYLVLQFPDLDHGLVGLADPVPDLKGQIEAIVKVGHGDPLDAGIHLHFIVLGLGTGATHGHPHRVMSGHGHRPLVACRPEDPTVEVGVSRIPEVPGKAV